MILVGNPEALVEVPVVLVGRRYVAAALEGAEERPVDSAAAIQEAAASAAFETWEPAAGC